MLVMAGTMLGCRELGGQTPVTDKRLWQTNASKTIERKWLFWKQSYFGDGKQNFGRWAAESLLDERLWSFFFVHCLWFKVMLLQMILLVAARTFVIIWRQFWGSNWAAYYAVHTMHTIYTMHTMHTMQCISCCAYYAYYAYYAYCAYYAYYAYYAVHSAQSLLDKQTNERTLAIFI